MLLQLFIIFNPTYQRANLSYWYSRTGFLHLLEKESIQSDRHVRVLIPELEFVWNEKLMVRLSSDGIRYNLFLYQRTVPSILRRYDLSSGAQNSAARLRPQMSILQQVFHIRLKVDRTSCRYVQLLRLKLRFIGLKIKESIEPHVDTSGFWWQDWNLYEMKN